MQHTWKNAPQLQKCGTLEKNAAHLEKYGTLGKMRYS